MYRKPRLVQRARTLRQKATPQEQKVWKILRCKRYFHLHWKRQQSLGPYVVDFYCHEKKLIIEVDGGQHGTDEGIAHDSERTTYLNQLGYTVIRFWNEDVDKHMNDVLTVLQNCLVHKS